MFSLFAVLSRHFNCILFVSYNGQWSVDALLNSWEKYDD
jgi:hypothetical protein